MPTINRVEHPGFQLLNRNEWFNAAANAAEKLYSMNYASAPTKRDWTEGRGLVMNDGNYSRVASPKELRR